MATKEVGTDGQGTTGDGKERQRKAPEPIMIGATHASDTMLQVGASVPGNVYDALVTLAASHDGAVDGAQLVRRFLNEEVQRGLFAHVGTDYETWYATYTEHRKATRQQAGSSGGTAKATTSVLTSLLTGDNLSSVLGWRDEIAAANPEFGPEQVAVEISKRLAALSAS